MNKEQFYNYLNNPAQISLEEIDEVIKEFPYFQSIYLLKAKALANNKSIKYDNQIKISSLYALDRKFLYEYIHSNKNVVSQEKTKIIEPELILEKQTESESIKLVEQKEEKIPEITETKQEEIIIEKNPEKEEVKETTKPVLEEKKEEIIEPTEEKQGEKVDIVEKVAEAEIEKQTIEEEKITPQKIEKGEVKQEFKTEPIANESKTIADIVLEKLKDRIAENKGESVADRILRQLKDKQKAKDILDAKKKIETPSPKPIIKQKRKIYFVKIKPNNIPIEIEKEAIVENEIIAEKPKFKIHFVKIKLKKQVPIKVTVLKEKEEIVDNLVIEELDNIIEKPIIDYFSDEEPDKIEQEEKSELAESEMGFEDWLNFVENRKVKDKKSDKSSLIDKFISENPSISVKADSISTSSEDYFNYETVHDDNYITETLANIYIKQGLLEKAILSFEKLSLKYPQKSIYFASRIKEVEKLIKN